MCLFKQYFFLKGDKTQQNSNANVNRPDEALAQIIEEHINNNETENDNNNNMERLIFIENDPENQNSAVMYYYNIHYKE